MGPLKHERDFSKLRDAYGIKAPDWAEALELDGRLQGVVLLDDVRHVVPPVDVPFAAYNAYEGAGAAGTYAGARIKIGGRNGAYLISAVASAASWIATENLNAFTGTGGFQDPGILGGRELPMQTRIETGTVTVRAVGRFELTANIVPGICPMWFAPGRVIQMCHSTAATAYTARIVLQEIP